jgi:DNA-binding NarL/FixJ family response regulator
VTEPLRVLVADDHAPTRFGVRDALEAGGCLVVGEAPNATEAVAVARQTEPDVCLLDIDMPGDGIRAADEITRALPQTAVVMLTASRDDQDLFNALRVGASGYLLKDMDPDRLPAALRGVLDGEAALPRALVARVLEEFRGRPRRGFLSRGSAAERLTSRELEVFQLLGQGLTTEQVAQQLFVSPVTVRGYVSASLKKLRVSSRAEALRLLTQD